MSSQCIEMDIWMRGFSATCCFFDNHLSHIVCVINGDIEFSLNLPCPWWYETRNIRKIVRGRDGNCWKITKISRGDCIALWDENTSCMPGIWGWLIGKLHYRAEPLENTFLFTLWTFVEAVQNDVKPLAVIKKYFKQLFRQRLRW